ncbi:MAG: enoyl-CoA hydratase/isomerase family protein [Hyphomicrobiales bacterium]
MTFEGITIDRRDWVATVTIEAPPLNLLSETTIGSLVAAFGELQRDSDTRCIVLRGAGARAFSAGAKLDPSRSDGPEGGEEARELGRSLIRGVEMCSKPVIAAIRGWCIGGGFALAQACDIRVAADDAVFRTGDAYIGVIPSWGISLTRLAHFIGRNHALDLLILGEDVRAEEAKAMGLLSKVLPAAEFDAGVAMLAARVASGSPLVFRAIKEGVHAQYYHSPEAAMAIETDWARRMHGTFDMREGIAALKERRKPNFRGE